MGNSVPGSFGFRAGLFLPVQGSPVTRLARRGRQDAGSGTAEFRSRKGITSTGCYCRFAPKAPTMSDCSKMPPASAWPGP